jgi:hypothetical protein
VQTRTYEALLLRAENLALVRAQTAAVERVGGRVVVAPPTPAGGVIVTLILPVAYTPEQIFPGLPFYAI